MIFTTNRYDFGVILLILFLSVMTPSETTQPIPTGCVSNTTAPMTNEDCANNLREKLQSLETYARNYIDSLKVLGNGEAIAQATLAMRHIEDARMRYGKVIQYLGDGVSVYDKK